MQEQITLVKGNDTFHLLFPWCITYWLNEVIESLHQDRGDASGQHQSVSTRAFEYNQKYCTLKH